MNAKIETATAIIVDPQFPGDMADDVVKARVVRFQAWPEEKRTRINPYVPPIVEYWCAPDVLIFWRPPADWTQEKIDNELLSMREGEAVHPVTEQRIMIKFNMVRHISDDEGDQYAFGITEICVSKNN